MRIIEKKRRFLLKAGPARLASALVVAAVLGWALLAPASAFAFTLSPASATDLTGTVQTLTATGLTPGTIVSFGIVSGPNSSVVIPDGVADGTGTATSSYVGANAGIDDVAACVDPDHDDGPGFGPCYTEAIDGTDDAFLSHADAEITWEQTLVLTPPGAFNLTGGQHTVTATINGVARCIGGSNDGTICTTDDACTDGGTCSDKSGLNIGFRVTGANPQDTGLTGAGHGVTDANGQATFTYTGTNAGTDTIQACADYFGPDTSESVAECVSEPNDFSDIPSNTARKIWGTQAATLTPPIAFNAVGTTHTVQTAITGVSEICSGGANHFNTCSSNADCTTATPAVWQAIPCSLP